jgi:hypothetical protein
MSNIQKRISFKDENQIFEIENKKDTSNVNISYFRIKKDINEIYKNEYIAVKLINKFSMYTIHYDTENSININLDNSNIEWYDNKGVNKFIELLNNFKFRNYFIGIFNYLCHERLNLNIKNKNLHFKVGDLVFRIDKISEKNYY